MLTLRAKRQLQWAVRLILKQPCHCPWVMKMRPMVLQTVVLAPKLRFAGAGLLQSVAAVLPHRTDVANLHVGALKRVHLTPLLRTRLAVAVLMQSWVAVCLTR